MKYRVQASEKIISFNQFRPISGKLRKCGKTIVLTNGCFDILHSGHILSLEYASSLGDILVVGINSDSSIKLNKGKTRPVVPIKSRSIVLASLAVVDYVIVFEEKTAERLIREIAPDVYSKGGDYDLDDIVSQCPAIHVDISPYEQNISTTLIIGNYVKRYSLDT